VRKKPTKFFVLPAGATSSFERVLSFSTR
jgi:hypothetical protein